MTTDRPGCPDRRSMLRAGAAVGAAAWVAPTVLSGTPAAAGTASSPPLILSVGVQCMGEPGDYNFPVQVAPAAVGLRYDLVLSDGYSYCGIAFTATVPLTSFTVGTQGHPSATWVEIRLVESDCTLIESSGQVPLVC